MNITLIISIVGIAFGIFLIVYAGYDDSPGGQLLGFVVLIASIVGVVKTKKRSN